MQSTVRARVITIHLLLALAALPLATGCSSSAAGPSDPAAIEQAIQRGTKAMLDVDWDGAGEAWIMRQVAAKSSQKDQIEAKLKEWIEKNPRDEMARLVNPEAKPAKLQADPGEGMQQLSIYTQASVGEPEDRATKYIRNFLATDESGYALTHQLIVLKWAEQSGLDLPEDVMEKEAALLKRVEKEQLEDQRFSDLFIERAALLTAYGSPTPAERNRWVKMTLSAQGKDGFWFDDNDRRIYYDGTMSKVTPTKTHTTALALWFLQNQKG